MVSSKIENHIVKYLLNESTSGELDQLSQWIMEPKNQKKFQKYIQSHYKITISLNKPDVEKIKKNLLSEIKKDKTRLMKQRARKLMAYASVGILLLGLGYNILKDHLDRSGHQEPLNIGQSVIIETSNGDVQPLSEEGSKIIRSKDGKVLGKQNGAQLVYLHTHNLKSLSYNTIRVPYGKRFNVVLSDGTRVYLNSGTSLKYPVEFLKGQDRQVFLSGEAYFDVAEDSARPFKVHADEIELVVLGTMFNISYYPENPEIQTVLVEGSVEIKNRKMIDYQSIKLKPGKMGKWNKKTQKMSIESVDTYIHTAWMQDKLIFRFATFKSIRHALERKYNVTIKNLNGDLDQQRFDASFDIESIDEVLQSFSRSYDMDYKIVNNEIIIE